MEIQHTDMSLWTLALDRWRFRDAAATVSSDDLNAIELDAPAGQRVPLGVAPVVAGLAFAKRTCASHALGDLAATVSDHRRRTRISVTYGPAVATIEERLTLETTSSGGVLRTAARSAQGLVATIEQVVADATLAEDPSVLVGDAVAAGQGREEFARIRNARWCYVAGEMCPVYGDHMAATEAGLPGVLVPETLLLGIFERRLFAEVGTLQGKLEVEFARPVVAGSVVEATPVTSEADAQVGSLRIGDELVAIARLVYEDPATARLLAGSSSSATK